MTLGFLNTNEERFWNWFSNNSDRYCHFENDRDRLFLTLKTELGKINPNLVFEFSNKLEDGSREFVISADGVKRSFPAVMNLVNQAPELRNWKIIAFRQPHKDVEQVSYEGLSVSLSDIFFFYTKDNGKVDLQLHMRGFYESPEWTGISFILLDTVLGEFDSSMYISGIDKRLLIEEEISNLIPIKNLPEILLAYKFEINN
jgi:hypothetical protein